MTQRDATTTPAQQEQEARELLANLYLPEGVEIWLNGRHKAFGERPIEMIQRGDGRRVLQMIHALSDGAYL